MSEQSGPFSGGGSVRRALSLGICYVLGTFNDNFFKQGPCFWPWLQATLLFPHGRPFFFHCLSPCFPYGPAGWRIVFPKRIL